MPRSDFSENAEIVQFVLFLLGFNGSRVGWLAGVC